MPNRSITQWRCQDKINANNLFLGLHLALVNGRVKHIMKKEVDLEAKEAAEIIKKILEKELGKIADELDVDIRTVKNYSYGSQRPGRQAGKLLENYAKRRGVI